ncbi:hypothetical protein A2973_04725 [Candidatus Gottesmanbacteria bacterium RIFCSPLOWO2_01_FULL_49_10]|uniref:Uncharacterized protein n=1 Tax=Candidatus Gottesmanbacteria bacterium RIFCSPLOWO2_01_FULL_49_10 TaxID=1798396 RepID=A0A1F6B112_9BACT|nr:MAG: hypothetical protein A2973_04725 [Candidatus Gottesmanbacteria bacterium RIFCSPLOWO2_01_FULL_49_10]
MNSLLEAGEVSIDVDNLDPRLLGVDFHCAGSDAVPHPMNRGDIVGAQVEYATRDEEGNVIESRSFTPLRGCINYGEGSSCKMGKLACPVASVVSIEDYAKRIKKLRALPKTT